MLAGAAYVAVGTDALTVKSVRVQGAQQVSPALVLSAADIVAGTPMLRLDSRVIRARVVANLPGIATVAVQREWPSTVRLVVTERTAAAAVPQAGRFLLVDSTGVGFRTVPAAPKGLVILQVRGPHPRDAATVAGLSVLSSLPPDLSRLLARVDVATPEQVLLTLRDRRRIVWGDAGEATAKIAIVRVLLTRPGRVIDVSAPGLATVR